MKRFLHILDLLVNDLIMNFILVRAMRFELTIWQWNQQNGSI